MHWHSEVQMRQSSVVGERHRGWEKTRPGGGKENRMALIAKSMMSTRVLSVSPETPLVNVHRIFVEEEIHGAPVVDETNAIQGVISSADLLRAVVQEREAGGADSGYLREMMEFSSSGWQTMPDDFQDRLAQLRVEDFMTRDVVSVAPDTPIAEVAQSMRRDRVHRVFVVDGEALVGVISALDLVALLEDAS